MPTLILTPRFREDAQALWAAAVRCGWNTERLGTWRVPDHLLGVKDPVLYVEGMFGPTLAASFGLKLLEPPEDWLPSIPAEYRKREVRLTTLGEARSLAAPSFVKPPNDKSFPARVYLGSELPPGFPADSPVLVSEVVGWEKEFRCHVLDRKLRTMSVYLRNGELQRAIGFAHEASEESELREFVGDMLADARIALPRAVVMDVGVIRDRGWAVVELNSAWGSGIYGCDPEQVLEVLRFAANPA